MAPGGPTAVVVDRWPVVRMGIAVVLEGCGVRLAGEATRSGEGLLVCRARQAALLVLGSPADGLQPSTVRSAKQQVDPPRVLCLVSGRASAEVGGLFAAGAEALLPASAGPDEIGDAVARVLSGERVVGAALSPGFRSASPDDTPAEDAGAAAVLTAKEHEVLHLLAQGHSTKQIARALFVSDATVKTHLQHIYAKLAVRNRHGALSRAAELGLLTG